MRPKTYLTLALLCVLFTACGVSCAYSSKTKPKPKKVQVRDQALIVDIGMLPHKEYIVRERIDLQGNQVNVPEGVIITFKRGGSIVNGILNGNETKLNSKNDEVIGVKLKGTWCVEKVSDRVFNRDYLSDDEIINNFNTIQSDTIHNELSITRDYSITIKNNGGSGLILKSNTELSLNAKITLLPNNHKVYYIINIQDKDNVSIKGGSIVGDVGRHTYIEGTTSEWGMGVNIKNSSNISVTDMYITLCTGDGIYVTGNYEPAIGIYDYASKNVTINNVVCDNNRRQGISVIHVDGLKICKSSFVNTGQIEGTSPSAGIDIEPEVLRNCNMSVRNVLVEDCIFLNNKGMSVETNCTYESEGKVNYENIVFRNCKSDGLLKAQSDDLRFYNCTFKEIRIASLYAPTRISFEGCIISGGYGIMIYAPTLEGINGKDRLLSLVFKDCTISTIEEETRTQSLISCYHKYIPNIEKVVFDDCKFSIPESKDDDYHFTDYAFGGKLHIYNSVINLRGRILNAKGIEMSGNRIRCREITNITNYGSNSFILDR